MGKESRDAKSSWFAKKIVACFTSSLPLMQTFKVNTILTLTVDMTLHLDGIFQLEKRNRYT